MNEHFAPGQQGDATAELSNGPGRRLRVARQALGIELDRVAGELHLRASMIESLEHDDYESLPAQVYVIGYIRKYARLVGLDPEPLLAAYPTAAPLTEPVHSLAAPGNVSQIGSGHFVVRLISIGILILLAALTYVWWQDQRPVAGVETVDREAEQATETAAIVQDTQEPLTPVAVDGDLTALPAATQFREPEPPEQTSLPAQALAPTTTEKRAATAAFKLEEAVTEDADNAQTAAEDSGFTVTDQPAAAPDAAQNDGDQAAVAATRQVVMSFDGPCWVDVRDSEREYKLFGEMKKGDRHVLEGEPPYSIILGNAAAVRITVGGAAFDLGANSRGNVARFILDPGKGQGPRAEGQENASSALDPIP